MYRQEKQNGTRKKKGVLKMKKAEMMNKIELDIMAMENVSDGTGPLDAVGPVNYPY